MTFFEETYKKLFGTKSINADPVVVTSVLKRSESYQLEYKKWKKSVLFNELIPAIADSFYWCGKGVGKTPKMDLFKSSYSNGFSISHDASIEKRHFQYLFDFFSEQVKYLDYRLVVSRETMADKGEVVERRQMHYLKPKMGFVAPIDQKYGNVQIEYLEINDEPQRIKFVANSYPDRQYKEAQDFQHLAEYVLSIK
ncbi:MAG: hypothetical protein AAF789_02730 [Bacteroidota bacterium]